MIKFALPGMYENYEVLIPLISLMKTRPQYFRPNVDIAAVFGNFQFCSWDGGRIFRPSQYKHASSEVVQLLKKIYNDELDVPIRFVYTSALTDKSICSSHFDNLVTCLCEDEKNEIVVAGNMLEEYLRENFPKYSFISSTTKCIISPEDSIAEICNDKYKMTCIDYNLNKNKKFLSQIQPKDRNKVEFLINAICPPGCPVRKKHYMQNSLFNATYGEAYSTGECNINKDELFPSHYYNNFTWEEIEEYNDEGFEYFKIEGRTFTKSSLILTLVQWLVKPEYQMYVVNFLLGVSSSFNLITYSLDNFKELQI